MAFENKVIVITGVAGDGDGAGPARQLALKLIAPSKVDTMARAALARRPQQQPH